MTTETDTPSGQGAASSRPVSLVVLAAPLILILLIAPDVLLVIFAGAFVRGVLQRWRHLDRRSDGHRPGLGDRFVHPSCRAGADRYRPRLRSIGCRSVQQAVAAGSGGLRSGQGSPEGILIGKKTAEADHAGRSHGWLRRKGCRGCLGHIRDLRQLRHHAVYQPSCYLGPQTQCKGLLALLAPSWRADGVSILDKATATLGNWLVAQLMAMTIVGVLTWLGLWLIGVPLAPILGLIAALLAFTPNIRPIIPAATAVLLAAH